MKICSACLLGIECRYNNKSAANKKILKLARKDVLIPVCPEQLGGLPTPREPTGIYGGVGEDVLKRKATVRVARDGKNLTEKYVKGAKETLKIIKLLNIKEAILKQTSPSCGCGKTWQLDKNFKNHKINGNGVLAALLKKNGIKIITEEDL